MARRRHDLEALTRELRSNTRALERTETRREQLFARRLDLFQKLVDAGVPQVEIAPLANVTPMAVSFALHRARQRGNKRPRQQ